MGGRMEGCREVRSPGRRAASATGPAALWETPARLGVYVHFPFCTRRCPYCDFSSVGGIAPPHQAYRDAVLAELAVRGPAFAALGPAVSLYFGGGTPSLWAPACVAAIIDAVGAGPGLRAGAEITLEANPGTLDLSRLRDLRRAGVGRISLGLQSFQAQILAALGRDHGPEESRRALDALRRAGFESFSLDLIQGLAGQTLEAAMEDLDEALRYAPPHISTYQLTIHAGTPFGARAARGERLDAPEALQIRIYEESRARLAAAGVLPYEISNAARPGQEAVHNSLYWTEQPYLALGAGAHGFWRSARAGARWANEAAPDRYMRAALAGAPAERFHEALGFETMEDERLLTGLRLDRGLAPGAHLEGRYGRQAGALAEQGWLIIEGSGRWRASDRGRLLLDWLLLELMTPA